MPLYLASDSSNGLVVSTTAAFVPVFGFLIETNTIYCGSSEGKIPENENI